MQTFTPITLQTARLTLRFLRPNDAAALYPIFSDPEAMRYWSSTAWTDPSQADAHIEIALAGCRAGATLSLAITVTGEDIAIGVCRMYAFSAQNRRCDIGYMLSREHWGNGYMHEALTALIGYAFGPLDLLRIEADIDPRNRASAALLERLHFVHEGHMRQRWIVGGEVCDSDFYGLLRQDWLAGQQKMA